MVKRKYHVCEYKDCKEVFNSKRALNSHRVETHCSYNVFQCHICNKSLSTNQSLKEHLNTHSGNRPYKCPFSGCKERFRQSSQLSVHKKVHKLSIALAEQERNYASQSVKDDKTISSKFLPSIDLSKTALPSPDPKFNF